MLDKLQKKYHYHTLVREPEINCERCHGTGEHLNGRYEITLCICTCVGLDGIGAIFSETLKNIRDEEC